LAGSATDGPGFAREVPLDLAALATAQDSLAAWLEATGVAGPARYRVRLVIEELLANLIQHGRFAGPVLPARLLVATTAAAVEIAIEDAAAPFDPRTAPEPAGPPSLQDDRVGGLGLSLLRRMAEIRAYRRLADGWNRTEVVIPRRDATQGGCG
jgi:anti-sigma regulatory factor (Ser/Thr protein kinase)